MPTWSIGLLSLLLIASIAACTSTDQSEIETHHDDGSLATRYQVDAAGQRHGFFERFENGVLVEHCFYHQGHLHGKRTLYGASGEKIIEETHENGLFTGPYRTFFNDGQIEQEGQYMNDKMVGIWTRFYPGGRPQEEVTMLDNLENGPFREFYENGNLKAEGTYHNGDFEHGVLKLYDEKGELEREMTCNMGVCHTTWQRQSQ